MHTTDAHQLHTSRIKRFCAGRQDAPLSRVSLSNFFASSSDFRCLLPASAPSGQAHGLRTPRLEMVALTLNGPAALYWEPPAFEQPRMLVVLMAAGQVNLVSSGGAIVRPPSAALALPTDGHAVIHLRGARPECVILSVSSADYAPNVGTIDTTTTLPALSSRRISPLYALLWAFITVSGEKTRIDRQHLIHTLPPAITSVVEAIAQCSPAAAPQSMFERACHFIDENYANSTLNISMVAEHLGIPVRAARSVFSGNGTTFFAELRTVRARAVRGIQSDHPHIQLAESAAMCGFSSVSAMYRALRATAEMPSSTPLGTEAAG